MTDASPLLVNRPQVPTGAPVVGIVGGGQLARMCAGPATELGLGVVVLAESTDAAAAQVFPQAPLGRADDLEALRELARVCDVVTFDHEHVPADVLAVLQDEGVALHPAPDALLHAQDKVVMRRALSEAGLPVPRWAEVTSTAALEEFAAGEWPVVLKTPRGGYDGKGVMLVDGPADLERAAAWFDRAEGAALLAEQAVAFRRELAVMVARTPSGEVRSWPVVHTVQEQGICTRVEAPASEVDRALADDVRRTAEQLAEQLGVTGVMAVEVFETGAPTEEDRGWVVNELAMRPHNSGHWTQDGSTTDQFEQHLRAVLDMPLGETAPRSTWTVMANVLGGAAEDLHAASRRVMAGDAAARIHLYGKEVRPGRKVGHVTVCGDDLDDLRRRAETARALLEGTDEGETA
ncbi:MULTISPECIES: 5-(carboxyamino)imidazole ribonucleotide synthase [Kytococcus]|uniref:N5-carboxyaminoimidazole ribonucleotide synthase n=1 Tax=Kytococcus schroeteri TaxID=138300 RepID=A0A2I1P935_9MICO|nr:MULTISPECIES: 5-(carboxyamino)imidazole ribonucleotide synthase [Kytococcus]OFS14600.1 5-(carboxyamino)imidazole ribonucleotide synthase [Kytococcus sp. HMSC28H12]PKZ41146.1 5-(carboxyamino)imidazole ribonucleotide synthase [Kytococcus schroeteri]